MKRLIVFIALLLVALGAGLHGDPVEATDQPPAAEVCYDLAQVWKYERNVPQSHQEYQYTKTTPVSHQEYRFPVETRTEKFKTKWEVGKVYAEKVYDNKGRLIHNPGDPYVELYGPYTVWADPYTVQFNVGSGPHVIGDTFDYGQQNYDSQGRRNGNIDYTYKLVSGPTQVSDGYTDWTSAGFTSWGTDPTKPANTSTTRYGTVQTRTVTDPPLVETTDWTTDPVVPEGYELSDTKTVDDEPLYEQSDEYDNGETLPEGEGWTLIAGFPETRQVNPHPCPTTTVPTTVPPTTVPETTTTPTTPVTAPPTVTIPVTSAPETTAPVTTVPVTTSIIEPPTTVRPPSRPTAPVAAPAPAPSVTNLPDTGGNSQSLRYAGLLLIGAGILASFIGRRTRNV